jgi:hypothetical protein
MFSKSSEATPDGLAHIAATLSQGLIVQKPTEPFPALYRTGTSLAGGCHRHEYDIAFPLVWTLVMIMRLVLLYGVSQRAFAKEDEL